MLELVKHIVNNLVDNKTGVQVEEKEDQGVTVYLVTVDREDRGRVIGREGRTIKAIRALVSAGASKTGKRTVVKIVD